MSGSGSVDKFDTVMNDVFGILGSVKDTKESRDRTKRLTMFIIGIRANLEIKKLGKFLLRMGFRFAKIVEKGTMERAKNERSRRDFFISKILLSLR